MNKVAPVTEVGSINGSNNMDPHFPGWSSTGHHGLSALPTMETDTGPPVWHHFPRKPTVKVVVSLLYWVLRVLEGVLVCTHSDRYLFCLRLCSLNCENPGEHL